MPLTDMPGENTNAMQNAFISQTVELFSPQSYVKRQRCHEWKVAIPEQRSEQSHPHTRIIRSQNHLNCDTASQRIVGDEGFSVGCTPTTIARI